MVRHYSLTILTFVFSISSTSANLITNGSFENGAFVNQVANYMELSPGDSALTGWSIFDGPVAWGLGANDVIPASDGIGYIDLSGFGANAPNGSIGQSFSTTSGLDYKFSFSIFGDLSQVAIDGNILTLNNVGSTNGWTDYSSVFTASSNSSDLTISNITPGSLIVFIDDVSVTAVSVPEPSMLILMGAGLAGLGFTCRRKQHA